MPRPLNQQTGMPQMNAAFGGWMITINLLRIIQEVVDGFVNDIETTITLSGTWQPLSMEAIALKPDGQRSWEWINLHVQGGGIIFETNDRIKRDNVVYKVMAVKDWRLNNYTEYHLVKDYESVPPAVDEIYVVDGLSDVFDGLDRVIDG